jgi:hypothetical protein
MWFFESKKRKPFHLLRDEKAYFPWYHSSSFASANALILSVTGIPAGIYFFFQHRNSEASSKLLPPALHLPAVL